VLTMSVSPGFGGQAFESVALEKIRQLSTQVGGRVLLEVDGGVNTNTIGQCGEAGVDLFVVGSAIFKQPDYGHAVAKLSDLATSHRRTH
jgi:ribulose-phosphate 3-epimerase